MRRRIRTHNDFDGLVSAAILLREPGWESASVRPVDLSVVGLLPPCTEPTALLDLPPREDAWLYADHHESNRDAALTLHGRHPAPHPIWVCDPGFTSTARLLHTRLHPDRVFTSMGIWALAVWADHIDAAQYAAPRDYLFPRDIAVAAAQRIPRLSSDAFEQLAVRLSREPEHRHELLERVVTCNEICTRNRAILDAYAPHYTRYGDTTILDLVDTGLPAVRFAPFYHYPECVFGITLFKANAAVVVFVARNKWTSRGANTRVSARELLQAVTPTAQGHDDAAVAVVPPSTLQPELTARTLAVRIATRVPRTLAA
jgi:hypothetical protein